MDTLRIEGTNTTPKVSFDAKERLLEISGYSRPENVRDFYAPLLQWVEDFKSSILASKSVGIDPDAVTFKFKFIYFNSSSAKFIYDIILQLNEMQSHKIPLKLYWYFDEDDDELREAGEELSDMANLPFFYIEVKRQ